MEVLSASCSTVITFRQSFEHLSKQNPAMQNSPRCRRRAKKMICRQKLDLPATNFFRFDLIPSAAIFDGVIYDVSDQFTRKDLSL